MLNENKNLKQIFAFHSSLLKLPIALEKPLLRNVARLVFGQGAFCAELFLISSALLIRHFPASRSEIMR